MKKYGTIERLVLAAAVATASVACSQQGISMTPAPAVRPPASQQARVPKRQPNYTVAILAGFGGNFDSATGINERGDVSGFSLYPGTGPVHAARWRDGAITDLGTLGGLTSGLSLSNEEHSINASDVITGSSETATPDPNAENKCGFSGLECRAFLWKHGTMTALPTLGGNNAVGAAINNRGQVVGVSETSTLLDCYSPIFLYDFFGFIWDRGHMTKLAAESGDQGTLAADINDRGDVVGTSGYCAVAAHSVLWEGRKIIDLGSLGGANGQLPSGINNREEVVGASDLPGDYQHHAFLWRRGAISDLGTLPGDVDSEAQNINNGGQIAGFSFDAYGNVRAVLWSGGTIYDLNTLVPPSSGIFLQEALDINARGQIAGFGCIKCDGSDQIPFLATPTGSYSISRITKSKLPVSGRSPVTVKNFLRGWGRHTSIAPTSLTTTDARSSRGTPAAGGVFSGAYAGGYTLICSPSRSYFSFNGTGSASFIHLSNENGELTGTQECVSGRTWNGKATLTSLRHPSNTISVSLTVRPNKRGVLCSDPACSFSVTGGTGKFENATGSGSLTITEGNYHTYNDSWSGTITY